MASLKAPLALVALLLTAACASTTAAASRVPSDATNAAPHGPSAPGPSAPGPRATAVRVVGLGDSVMAGNHCECAGLAEEYAKALGSARHEFVSATNLGEGGLETADVQKQLQPHGPAWRAVAAANIVLVTVGANDLAPQLDQWRRATCDSTCFTVPAEQMGDRLASVLQALRSIPGGQSRQVLVTDYWNVFTDGDVARADGGEGMVQWSSHLTRVANAAICRAAASVQATCVDLYAPFKGTYSTKDPTPLLAADGDHPNAQGIQVIVRELIDHTPVS